MTKKAVMIIACLHVLHNMEGQRQWAEAELLKDKLDGAPITLRDAITALAPKKRPAEPAAKRRKMVPDIGEGTKQPSVTTYAAVGA